MAMRASPGGPTADTKTVIGMRWARKAAGEHRHAPSPVTRFPCWCLRRGRAYRAWARRPGAAPRPRAHEQHGLFMGGQVVDTHRRGKRNHARTEKARARVQPAVPAAPAAGRSALESHQQGHTEQLAGARSTADDQFCCLTNFRQIQKSYIWSLNFSTSNLRSSRMA